MRDHQRNFNFQGGGDYSLFKISKLGVIVIGVFLISCTVQSTSAGESSSVVVSESETKTIEPTNNPTKVFVRRRIFRKLVKDSSNEEPVPTTTPLPTTTSTKRTLYSLVKKLDTSVTTGSTLKSSMSSSQMLASKQKFNFQSLKTRLGLAAGGGHTTTDTPTFTSRTTNDSSLVMIPLPPSQRKPYTPVIMQVSKSTTAKPEATVQTYKLSKMFVPIGIYGKVVENGTTTSSNDTIVTSIRHKGTSDSSAEDPKKQPDNNNNNLGKSSRRKVKGIAENVDLTYARPNLDMYSLTTEKPDIGSISFTTESNDLFSGMFSSQQTGSNSLRRDDGANRRKQPFGSPSGSSGMTLMTPPKLGTKPDESPSTLSDALGSYSSYASYSTGPHKKFTPSSIVDSITDSMSRIPSLVPSFFHKGLTSLASMTSSLKENPFVDDNFDAGSSVAGKKHKPLVSIPGGYRPMKIPASVPGGYIQSGVRDQAYAGSEVTNNDNKGAADLGEYETLEYFRKRPYLLAQLRKERMMMMDSWKRGIRFSRGFKPVNAPEYLAREYYKSTSTASTPEEILANTPHPRGGRFGKKSRGSWLLRNSDEYVADKNDKLVRMWRNMLESFTTDEVNDETKFSSKTRRIDEEDPEETDDHENPKSSTISARRSSSTPNVLNAHWSSIKRKYSKDQINEAKDRILTLLNSGYGDEALHEIAGDDVGGGELPHHQELDYDTSSHMPPPPPLRVKGLSLTKGLSGAAAGAFKDLVKFFKLGVSVGAGHSKEPVNYEQVVDEQEGEEAGGTEWRPVRRPLISFSAGISLKSPKKLAAALLHPESEYEPEDIHSTTHYSSSSKPYIPNTYKGLNAYVHEFATTHVAAPPPPPPTHHHHHHQIKLKPTPYSYPDEEIVSEHEPPPQSLDYEEEDSVGYGSATSASYAPSPTNYHDELRKDYNRYSTLKPVRPTAEASGGLQASGSSWQPVAANPEDYELVPSSVYLSGRGDPRDIAAVVKPAGVSDAAVRSVLPAGLKNLRILNYPNVYSSSGASSLNSISQVLGGAGGGVREAYTGQNVAFKQAMKKLRENYVVKENSYLPPAELYGGSGTGEGGRVAVGEHDAGVSYTGGFAPSGSVLSNMYYNPVLRQEGGGALIGALSGLEGGNVFATADRINNLASRQQFHLHQQQQQQQQQQHQTMLLGGYPGAHAGGQKDALGFSTNYNLPSNLDPDIAALLKSELDKDDIPDDIRQEFLEAKEQEKKEHAQKAAATAAQGSANRRVDNSVDLAQQTLIDSLLSSAARSSVSGSGGSKHAGGYGGARPSAVPLHSYIPSPTITPKMQHPGPAQQQQRVTQYGSRPTIQSSMQYQAQSRAFNLGGGPGGLLPMAPTPAVVSTRFFAPIPLTPTMMTAAIKNPRYSSPVPRYVIELAQKLQGDKSVQGIVRVSAKRGRNLPPIEYLYPVKG